MERIGHLTAHLRNNKNPHKRIKIQYKPKTAGVYWMDFAKQIIGDFEKTEQLLECWRQLISYAFANSNCKLNLESGLGIIGQTGSGKTKTMEIFNKFVSFDDLKYYNNGMLRKFSFEIVQAKIIVGEYLTEGYESIVKYSTVYNLCIDDLGAEMEQSSHYGNKTAVISDIIEQRYNYGLFTHFTSNLDMDDIKKTYGDRVHSRIHEMCNIIIVNDKDFRIK